MATEFTWSILGVKCIPSYEGQLDVVSDAQWACYGLEYTETGNPLEAQVSGWSHFTYVPGEPYTPRSEVTEEQMLQWCWDGGVNKVEVEAEVQALIDAQKVEPIQN